MREREKWQESGGEANVRRLPAKIFSTHIVANMHVVLPENIHTCGLGARQSGNHNVGHAPDGADEVRVKDGIAIVSTVLGGALWAVRSWANRFGMEGLAVSALGG